MCARKIIKIKNSPLVIFGKI
uniref:Uncharacterized protein n=1 Tax=Amphimedon queenslandica TaxID=400682 RepID=A0A1X7UT55_AMPQE